MKIGPFILEEICRQLDIPIKIYSTPQPHDKHVSFWVFKSEGTKGIVWSHLASSWVCRVGDEEIQAKQETQV